MASHMEGCEGYILGWLLIIGSKHSNLRCVEWRFLRGNDCWSANEPVFEPQPALPRLDLNGNGGGFGTGGLPWVNIFGGSENLLAKMRERNAEALPQAPAPSASAANAAALLSSCSLVV
jgi:hypothetical protein